MTTRSGGTPTIIDVAEQAGVSIKTVSRVLNNEANVRPDTRAVVMAVVARLNYRPKQSARSLAGARSLHADADRVLWFDAQHRCLMP